MKAEKLNELKNTARNILTYNRLQLLNKHPFIGNIAMNLEIIPTRDARCNTAMTDGKQIFFDIDFLSRLTQDEIQFVLGHEIWHVVMLHFDRLESRNRMMFNIATDIEVNQILEKDGFIAPVDALFPNKSHSKKCIYDFPDGLSAEEYYELLIEFNKKDHKVPQKNDSKKDNKCADQFDKHFDKNENQEEALKDAMEKGASDKYGDKGKDEDYQPITINTDSEERELVEKVREMVVSSAQQYEKTRGDLPEYIKKHVSKLLDSKLPWRELLAAFITTGFENKTNWNTPNRRFAHNNLYLPSHDGDMMRIAVGIDTSGSCKESCEKFLTELSGITKNFDQYELHVIQCDTEVKNYTCYDENNPLDSNNPIEFNGFGGTNLHPIFQYLDLNDINVDAVVMFTDGYCEEFSKNEFFETPILWVIDGDNNCDNIEVGEKIHMNIK